MAAATATATTVGVFPTRKAADRAVADLKKAGYRDDQIGPVAKDVKGKAVKTDGGGHTCAKDGMAIGAAVGAASGAAVGIGILAGVIPVIGPVLALGTLGTILFNAVGGTAIASLTGAILGWGIAAQDAKCYEGDVTPGPYLVTVDHDDRRDEVRMVFTRHGGFDPSTTAAKR